MLFWQDVRYAVRQLLAAPTFTIVAAATLALGIGATTAIFSVVYAVVLQPFPFAEPERVVIVGESLDGITSDVSGANFNDWRTQSRSFDRLAAFHLVNFNLADAGAPERIVAARTTHEFFAVFGIQPLLGRTYSADEDQPGREQVVVLSHRLWARRFSSSPAVIGREIRMDGRGYTVIGVMPPAFDRMAQPEEAWVPVAFTPQRLATYDEHFLTAIGRLAPGVSINGANAELETIFRRTQAAQPNELQIRAGQTVSFVSQQVGDAGQRLMVLLGAVILVLLIACGNVAHLLLARGGARTHEFALRAALGAGRGRLVRQLLTETFVLALIGAGLGVMVLSIALPALLSWSPDGVLPRLDQVRVSIPVLAFALAAALVSALIAGLAPAVRTAGTNVLEALKEGGRGATLSRDRLRNVLVIGEISVAMILLIGAGLLVRSAINLQRVDVGFDPAGVLSARVTLPVVGYESPSRVADTFQRLTDILARSPGIEAAAVTSQAPMTPGGNANGLVPEGKVFDPNDFVLGRLAMVTSDYFRTMRIPIVAGRLFTDADRRDTPLVMILSETAARQLFAGESAVGKRVGCCEAGSMKVVVGVVGDVRGAGPQQPAEADFYLPVAQVPPVAWDWIQKSMTVVLRRSTGDPAAATDLLRTALAQIDPTVPLYNVASMESRFQTAISPARFNTVLMATLGMIGLLLAAIGVYGVVTYFVTQRQREIAIRMALGAHVREVLAIVLGREIQPILIGLAVGAAGALALARVLNAYVFDISPRDPLTLVAAAGVLLAATVVATLLPVWRATRVDPVTSLRSE